MSDGTTLYDAIDRALRTEIGRRLPSEMTASTAHYAARIAEEAAEEHIALLRTALELIVEPYTGHCANNTGDATCIDDGRSPYAKYGAEAWCEVCIARTALAGQPFPERGTLGVEER